MILSSFSKFDIRITKIPAGERHPDLAFAWLVIGWLALELLTGTWYPSAVLAFWYLWLVDVV